MQQQQQQQHRPQVVLLDTYRLIFATEKLKELVNQCVKASGMTALLCV